MNRVYICLHVWTKFGNGHKCKNFRKLIIILWHSEFISLLIFYSFLNPWMMQILCRVVTIDSNRGVQIFQFLHICPWFKRSSQNCWVQFRSLSNIEGYNCIPCTPLMAALLCINTQWLQLLLSTYWNLKLARVIFFQQIDKIRIVEWNIHKIHIFVL